MGDLGPLIYYIYTEISNLSRAQKYQLETSTELPFFDHKKLFSSWVNFLVNLCLPIRI